MLYFTITARSILAEEKQKKEENIKEWSHSSTAGLTFSSGNSESVTACISHTSLWEKKINKLLLSATGAYGVKESQDSMGDTYNDEFVKNFNLKEQFDRKFSERFYWYINQNTDSDLKALLIYRSNIGPGLGINVIKGEKFKFDFEAGSNIEFEKYDQQEMRDKLGARAGQKVSWKISSTSNFWVNIEEQINVEKTKDHRINAEIGLDVKINTFWNLRVALQDKYNSNAPKNIQQNDLFLITSVNIKY